MKKALVTGASGFLGSYILKALNAKSCEITTLGRREVDDYSFIQADLSHSDGHIPVFEKHGLVIHAAGKTQLKSKTKKEKQDFWNVNYRGTKNLLTSLSENHVLPSTIIFISTTSVYGLESGEDIDEKAPLDPHHPYGTSKKKAEEYVKWWATENNVSCIILRLPLITGRNSSGSFGAFINAIKNGKYISIANGSARKSMVMADDVAELIPQLEGKNGIYNLTDGYHPSFRELENRIQEITGKKIRFSIPFPIAWLLASAGNIAEFITFKRLPFNTKVLKKMTSTLTFSDQKARNELGWNPSKVLDRLEETV